MSFVQKKSKEMWHGYLDNNLCKFDDLLDSDSSAEQDFVAMFPPFHLNNMNNGIILGLSVG